MNNLHQGLLLAFAAVLCGSLAATAGKWISPHVNAHLIVLCQYVICLLLMLPKLLKSGIGSMKTRYPGRHLMRGLSGWGCFVLFYLALREIPLADATLLRNSAPLWVPLLGWLILREPWSRRSRLPLLVGFAGIALILKPSGQSSIWHLLGMLSGVGLALSMVTTRLLAAEEPAQRVLFYYFSFAILSSVPMATLHWQPIPMEVWPALLFIGVAMYLGFVCYTYAYAKVRASQAAPITYFGVVIAALIDWLLWRHTPDSFTIAGMLLVTIGALWLATSEKRSN